MIRDTINNIYIYINFLKKKKKKKAHGQKICHLSPFASDKNFLQTGLLKILYNPHKNDICPLNM